MYALNDITVIDNFLEPNEYNEIFGLINSGPFTWIRGTILVHNPGEEYKQSNVCYYQNDNMYNVQMMHILYRDLDPPNKTPGIMTDQKTMRVFVPLLSKIKPETLIRMKVNMTFNWGKQLFSGYHIDEAKYADNGMVGIYYINTNNGYTQFQNGRKVNCVANRMLFFPMNMYHSCVTATDVSNRFVVNINWLDSRRLGV